MADDKNQQQMPRESQIKKSGFNNFMTKLFGFRRVSNRNKNGGNNNSFSSSSGKSSIEFIKTDLDSNQRVGQAFLDQFNSLSAPLSEKSEKIFNYWLNDNTDTFNELAARRQRIDQLSYAVLNDSYIGQTVQLYADEACQLDEQDTIINIETPDPRMTRDMYNLLNLWGITQVRIRATIENLVTYGDAFWANKISEKGVERIIPLQQYQVTDRLEYNPIKALEMKKRKEGAFWNFANKNFLINQMLDDLEDTGDFADIFDTKLFGFQIDNDLVVPPWAITHFRVGYDLGQFFPFGTSLIINTLAPFKQTMSTMALQSLARVMSFPITLYKVKTSDAMDEARQFETVNNVREAFDNIGVTPAQGNSEVYTVNTKIWIPDGLVNVEVVKPEIDFGNVDDLKLYQERTAVATGIPKSFYNDDWYGFGTSGKSLTQQYKPFGRKVYSVQSAFLLGLSNLFRIHFAITGAYDFRIPFTLSMKYPAVEETDDRQNARSKSIEVANAVMGIVKTAIGAAEDEALPPDIVRDIIGKYTFLEPTDIMKWTRDAKYSVPNVSGSEEEGEGSVPDLGDFTFEGGTESLGAPELGSGSELGGGSESEGSMETPSTEEVQESVKNSLRIRENYLKENYKAKRDQIYFEALAKTNTTEFNREGRHLVVCNQVDDSSDLMLETLNKQHNSGNTRFAESFNTNFSDYVKEEKEEVKEDLDDLTDDGIELE